ncbi:MAG: sulfite exporter TauE/SafE family protein [Fibrobacteres bacterium]|nr:sulfite exporter TauE/SafE family protein [Fibrobacterota bacterium]
MIESNLPVLAALGLGVLTSVSPCPMASHAAAVSVLVRGAGSWKGGLVVGASYALGRAAAYACLAWILSAGIFRLGPLVRKIQFHAESVLGWVFLVGGLLLAISPWLNLPGGGMNTLRWKERFDRVGHVPGAFLLGGLLALAFCPVSAGIFFGSVVPLAVATTPSWSVTIPYGVATALPVFVLVVAAGYGTQMVARTFHATQKITPWLHRLSAGGMIAAGVWLLARSW